MKGIRATGEGDLLATEKLHKKIRVTSFVFWVLIAVLFVANVAASSYLESESLFPPIAAIPSVAIAFGYLFFWSKLSERYKASFRENVVVKKLQEAFDDLVYDHDGKLEESTVIASGLFPAFNKYQGNDLVSAKSKGMGFVESDVKLSWVTTETYNDDDGSRQTRDKIRPIFNGRLVVLDYDAVSNEPVRVMQRAVGEMAHAGEILTELDGFNRRFRIDAQDATSAFRILTPQVLEGIVQASDKLKCPMYLSFADGRIYVALAIGDSFDEGSIGDATLSELSGRVTWEIQIVVDLLDTLYLENGIQQTNGGEAQ